MGYFTKDFCINIAHTRSITLYNVELLTIKLIMYGGLFKSYNCYGSVHLQIIICS